MIKYLPVDELVFLGAEDCSSGYEDKNNIDATQPYVTIASDRRAACGRGMNTIFYRGLKVASEYMNPPRGAEGFQLSGPSLGLYKDAERWVLRNLSSILSDFK